MFWDVAHGFMQAYFDLTLFTKSTSKSFIDILFHVYDIILAETSLTVYDAFNVALDKTFHIKDLGKLKFFLGLDVARSSKGVSLFHAHVVS